MEFTKQQHWLVNSENWFLKLVPRTPLAEFPDKIAVTGEKVLEAEDSISFTPEAIHQVQAIGEEPVMCF